MLLWILGLGHAVVDIMQGALSILLPQLSEKFALSYSQVGLLSIAFTFSSAIIQPLFGLASDRYRMNWLLPLGVVAASVGMAATGYVPSYGWLVAAIILSGLGVAAYHPEGSKMANFTSAEGRQGASMSIYSLGGNVGIGVGPMLALFFLGLSGLKGSWGFLIPGALMTALLLVVYPRINGLLAEHQQETKVRTGYGGRGRYGSLTLLIGYVIVRSWVHAGLLTYIPFYFAEFRGMSQVGAGFLLTTFLISGAVGTALGGPLADRWGERNNLVGSMILSLVFLLPFMHSGGPWAFILAALLGASLISTFPVTVVFGQRLLPDKIGLASGLMLGFSVGTGSVGVFLLGLFADNFGLPAAMQVLSFLPLLGIFLTRFLPGQGQLAQADSQKQA